MRFSEPHEEGSCHLRRYRRTVTVASVFHLRNPVSQWVLFLSKESVGTTLFATDAGVRNVPNRPDE